MNARSVQYTVIDFETTGSSKGRPEQPWQVAMVELLDGRITGRHYEQYLHVPANRTFNPYAPGRHAEIRDVLAAAPTCAACWPDWKPWLVKKVLVAHNTGTEKKFLRRAAPLHFFGPWVDTLKLSHYLFPDFSEYSLSQICEELELADTLEKWCPGRTWHDALYDAYAAAAILEFALNRPSWSHVTLHTLRNLT